MTPTLKLEIENLIKILKLNCSVDEFSNKVDLNFISYNQKLSEEFIREFQDKVNWYFISYSQKLSENFIREFQNKVNWVGIYYNKKLNKEFRTNFYENLKPYLTEEEKTQIEKSINKRSFETAINNLTKNKLQMIE